MGAILCSLIFTFISCVAFTGAPVIGECETQRVNRPGNQNHNRQYNWIAKGYLRESHLHMFRHIERGGDILYQQV